MRDELVLIDRDSCKECGSENVFALPYHDGRQHVDVKLLCGDCGEKDWYSTTFSELRSHIRGAYEGYVKNTRESTTNSQTEGDK